MGADVRVCAGEQVNARMGAACSSVYISCGSTLLRSVATRRYPLQSVTIRDDPLRRDAHRRNRLPLRATSCEAETRTRLERTRLRFAKKRSGERTAAWPDVVDI